MKQIHFILFVLVVSLQARAEMVRASGGSAGSSASTSPTAVATYTADQLTKALRTATQVLGQRLPTVSEYTEAKKGFANYQGVIKQLIDSPEFLDSMKSYHQNYFQMAGMKEGPYNTNGDLVNFDEPTNLVLYLIKNKLDYRDVLRASYCIDNSGNKIVCSAFGSGTAGQTKADKYAAGVLTTRAFLTKWSGPFNFRRVNKAFMAFACSQYPDVQDTGLPIYEISTQVKNFSCSTCTPRCISCHSAINPRAVLFYNFSLRGQFFESISDIPMEQQTYRDDPIHSDTSDLLYGSAVPKYKGEKVSSLREYSLKFADSLEFRKCMVQRFTNLLLGNVPTLPLPSDFDPVVRKVPGLNYDLKLLMIEILSSDAYIKSR